MKTLLLLIGMVFLSQNLFSQDISKSKEKGDDSIRVAMNLSGSFQKILSESSTSGNDITEGSISFSIDRSWVSLNTSITIASTNDTVTQDYGSNVLIPKKGFASSNFNLNYRNFCGVSNVDMFFAFNVSSSIWRGKVTIDKRDTTLTANATNVSTALGFSYSFFRGSKKDGKLADFQCVTGVGWTLKSIIGDIGLRKNEHFRQTLLGTTEHDFSGPEFFLILGYKNLFVKANYSILNESVSGLSGGQFLASVGFNVNLVEGTFGF